MVRVDPILGAPRAKRRRQAQPRTAPSNWQAARSASAGAFDPPDQMPGARKPCKARRADTGSILKERIWLSRWLNRKTGSHFPGQRSSRLCLAPPQARRRREAMRAAPAINAEQKSQYVIAQPDPKTGSHFSGLRWVILHRAGGENGALSEPVDLTRTSGVSE